MKPKELSLKCDELYEKNGADAVYEYCNTLDCVVYSYCKGCNEDTPSHKDNKRECLVCWDNKRLPEDLETYRVRASMTTDLYLDVQAHSEEEAVELAEASDAGDFIEVDPYWSGEFKVHGAEVLKPKNKKASL